ncbi:MAG: PepSY domain-containing protein [Gammaproteobacteria bacterium]
MLRSKIIPATMAAAIALGATGAAFAATGGNDNTQEIAAALSAKTSSTQAIAAAEQQTGGRALKIGLEKEKGTYFYEVTTGVEGKAETVVSVDLASGAIVGIDDNDRTMKFSDSEDRSKLTQLASSSMTLASAIAVAEQHVGGKAVEATFEDEDGTAQFEIQVSKGNTLHKVMIDRTNGTVLKVSAAEAGEHDED